MRRSWAAAALLAAACHPAKPSPRPAQQSEAPAAPRAAPADAGPAPRDHASARAEAAWARRDSDPAALDQAIFSWEQAALRSADPSEPLLDAARARRLRILAAERKPDPEASTIAEDAQACAADARRSWIGQFPAAAALLDGAHEPAQVVELVGGGGAEALYLEAVCSATWARMQGFTPLIERRAELQAELLRVSQLAPDLDGAGAERELGLLFAALPAYAGGDLQQARRRLDAAVERAPLDARNRLALARAVAVKAQDRALFEQQLQAVAGGDDPPAAAEAASLLRREDELFGPAEAAQPIPGGPQK